GVGLGEVGLRELLVWELLRRLRILALRIALVLLGPGSLELRSRRLLLRLRRLLRLCRVRLRLRRLLLRLRGMAHRLDLHFVQGAWTTA
ncbi:MAG: hypothetical protein Q4G64_03955, partial [bacterium]|nr:hypothetical protein [bacterium]